MSKGQRGNKEAKKPKKDPPISKPADPSVLAPPAADRGRKKGA